MKRYGILLVVVGFLLNLTGISAGETTLEKIKRTGAFTVGTRTGSPPFGYINKQNEWGVFPSTSPG